MTFRYARHTRNLENLKWFYTTILGFEILGSFENHDGYDGVFIGKKHSNWHLEFTKSSENPKQVFDEDDILVFYPKDVSEFNTILSNIVSNKIAIHMLKIRIGKPMVY